MTKGKLDESLEILNLDAKVYITANGEKLPITNMFDSDGDETDITGDVVAFVAGPTSDGKWYTVEVSEFESSYIN